MTDVVIIGKGPAGLSAALYACRGGLKTVVVGMGVGALEKAELIENYFGLPTPISGKELLDIGISQAKNLGAEIVEDEVLDIAFYDHFIVTAKNTNFEAKSVILATGTARKKLFVQGLEEFEGKGVSYCAVCDAFFYRNKTVAVIGNSEYALHELNHLLPAAHKAYILTDGKELAITPPPSVEIITTKIKSVFGGDRVKGVEFTDDSTITTNGVFVAVGNASAVDFARKIGVETEGNKIVVDQKMMTNLPGMFAAGDCIGGVLQISTAVGEGAKAALGAMDYIRNSKM